MERPLVYALEAAVLPYRVANPRLIRDFARATGKLPKTDQIDARVFVEFARKIRPEARKIADPDTIPDWTWHGTDLHSITLTADVNANGNADIVDGNTETVDVYFGGIPPLFPNYTLSFPGCSDGNVNEVHSVGDFNCDDGEQPWCTVQSSYSKTKKWVTHGVDS